jgi:hypothetical protein
MRAHRKDITKQPVASPITYPLIPIVVAEHISKLHVPFTLGRLFQNLFPSRVVVTSRLIEQQMVSGPDYRLSLSEVLHIIPFNYNRIDLVIAEKLFGVINPNHFIPRSLFQRLELTTAFRVLLDKPSKLDITVGQNDLKPTSSMRVFCAPLNKA